MCDYCHTIADEETHSFERVREQPDLCYECHNRPLTAKFQHGPVALGVCTSCHNPHSAANMYMLIEKGPDLCYECHSEMSKHVTSSLVQHAVIEEKGCLVCHDPHQENFEFQLKNAQTDLCLECHESIRTVLNSVIVDHEPVTRGKMCSSCHNPHGSDVSKLLTNVEKELCLGCHNQPLQTADGPIIDMKSWLENNPEHHGPIREGICVECHRPHGSENFRMLRHMFPREFYRPFSLQTYALCFECHEQSLVLDEFTVALTGFRNGDKNLHYLHVNREKGRTCRACHEIHAGTKPKRIKDYVPFGQWEYPVNFEMTEFGGSCRPGCHVQRAYDRRKETSQK